ncbi:hypothetical protein L484_022174 [Morus notabilis]|uniref:Uncharacterized protein n=1 Tax=Morus notabilis TaxID=981085 RepID=W9R080_9ROSA|nr:hypothetical protein L484_022174 [Morus notabilis]
MEKRVIPKRAYKVFIKLMRWSTEERKEKERNSKTKRPKIIIPKLTACSFCNKLPCSRWGVLTEGESTNATPSET